jgi:hypothetical protein
MQRPEKFFCVTSQLEGERWIQGSALAGVRQFRIVCLALSFQCLDAACTASTTHKDRILSVIPQGRGEFVRNMRWRKGWDSNPRGSVNPLPVFKTGALNHSATLPGY